MRAVAWPSREIVASSASRDGVKAVNASLPQDATNQQRSDTFEGHFTDHLRIIAKETSWPLASLPAFISGMASSTIGWKELPYSQTPLPIDPESIRSEPIRVAGLEQPATLLSGARAGADVMRGEESQVLGLTQLPDFPEDEHLCILLPGTHCKHIDLQNGSIVDFRTYMSGELFDVISQHSILKESVEVGASSKNKGLEEFKSAFERGVDAGSVNGLAASLFSVRARSVLWRAPADENRAFLNGMIIGDELAHALRSRPDSSPNLVLAASESLRQPYHLALEHLCDGAVRMINPADVDRATVLFHAQLLERQLESQAA